MVAGLVRDGHPLADIGTDHAYLPVFLLQEGRIPSAAACDVREGPLQNAASIASMVLTTESLVADKPQPPMPMAAPSADMAGMY